MEDGYAVPESESHAVGFKFKFKSIQSAALSSDITPQEIRDCMDSKGNKGSKGSKVNDGSGPRK